MRTNSPDPNDSEALPYRVQRNPGTEDEEWTSDEELDLVDYGDDFDRQRTRHQFRHRQHAVPHRDTPEQYRNGYARGQLWPRYGIRRQTRFTDPFASGDYRPPSPPPYYPYPHPSMLPLPHPGQTDVPPPQPIFEQLPRRSTETLRTHQEPAASAQRERRFNRRAREIQERQEEELRRREEELRRRQRERYWREEEERCRREEEERRWREEEERRHQVREILERETLERKRLEREMLEREILERNRASRSARYVGAQFGVVPGDVPTNILFPHFPQDHAYYPMPSGGIVERAMAYAVVTLSDAVVHQQRIQDQATFNGDALSSRQLLGPGGRGVYNNEWMDIRDELRLLRGEVRRGR